MRLFRIYIYLSVYNFLKSLLSPKVKDKKISKIITKMSKKKYFIPTSQLRVGFMILLKYLKKNDTKRKEIIVQPFNLPEMVNIVKNLNFDIKFSKINLDTGEPDLKSLKTLINKKTLAIVLTNIFSSPSLILKVRELCKKKKIYLIEDNAIYFDNFFIKKKLKTYSGSIGDYSLYSFNIMKNISGFYGGGVSTNDLNFKKFALREISSYKNFSFNILIKQIIIFIVLKFLLLKPLYFLYLKILRYAHKKKRISILKLVYPSLKFKKQKFPKYYFSKISNISKIVVYNQLLDTKSRFQNHFRRKMNNSYYTKLFEKLKIKNVKLLKVEDTNFQNFMDYPILVKNKENLNNYLLSRGIETKQIFYHDCANIFLKKNYKSIRENSKYFTNSIIGLPNHPKVSKKYMELILKEIKNFYEIRF